MIIIVMGVSGCGKTTVGRLLAERLNLPFKDADRFHPDGNIQKMKSGIALDDADRKPWLENLNLNMKKWNRDNGAVLACSALKKTYRDTLREGFNENEAVFVFLKGKKDLISVRLKNREDHYMPAGLLDSQFEALEEPNKALAVSIETNPEDIVDHIISKLPEINQPIN